MPRTGRPGAQTAAVLPAVASLASRTGSGAPASREAPGPDARGPQRSPLLLREPRGGLTGRSGHLGAVVLPHPPAPPPLCAACAVPFEQPRTLAKPRRAPRRLPFPPARVVRARLSAASSDPPMAPPPLRALGARPAAATLRCAGCSPPPRCERTRGSQPPVPPTTAHGRTASGPLWGFSGRREPGVWDRVSVRPARPAAPDLHKNRGPQSPRRRGAWKRTLGQAAAGGQRAGAPSSKPRVRPGTGRGEKRVCLQAEDTGAR